MLFQIELRVWNSDSLNIIPNWTTRLKFGLLKKKLPFMLMLGEDFCRDRYCGRIVQTTALNWLSWVNGCSEVKSRNYSTTEIENKYPEWMLFPFGLKCILFLCINVPWSFTGFWFYIIKRRISSISRQFLLGPYYHLYRY